MPQGRWLAAFNKNCYGNKLKSVCILLIIQANFWWVNIPHYGLHDSDTRSTIAATMPSPKRHFSTINPNIVNSQHSPSGMNMNNVITTYTNHQKEIQNLTKKLQIFTHVCTLQSGRKIPAHNANHWTTVQPVHSIFKTTGLQLGSCLYASYWPKSLQLEDSQCNGARVAKPNPHHQRCCASYWQRDQEHGFGWLQGIAAVWWSSVEASVQTIGSLFSLSGRFLGLGAATNHHREIPPRYCRSYPRLVVGGCHPEAGSCNHHASVSGNQLCRRHVGHDTRRKKALGRLISLPPSPIRQQYWYWRLGYHHGRTYQHLH